jgi:hypothetical protein
VKNLAKDRDLGQSSIKCLAKTIGVASKKQKMERLLMTQERIQRIGELCVARMNHEDSYIGIEYSCKNKKWYTGIYISRLRVVADRDGRDHDEPAAGLHANDVLDRHGLYLAGFVTLWTPGVLVNH